MTQQEVSSRARQLEIGNANNGNVDGFDRIVETLYVPDILVAAKLVTRNPILDDVLIEAALSVRPVIWRASAIYLIGHLRIDEI